MINSHVKPFLNKLYRLADERKLKEHTINIVFTGINLYNVGRNKVNGIETKLTVYLTKQTGSNDGLDGTVNVVLRSDIIHLKLAKLTDFASPPVYSSSYHISDISSWEEIYTTISEVILDFLVKNVVPV